jgi:hypothetical protein
LVLLRRDPVDDVLNGAWEFVREKKAIDDRQTSPIGNYLSDVHSKLGEELTTGNIDGG